MDEAGFTQLRNALRPRVGALAYVIVDDTLNALGIGRQQLSGRHFPAFLSKLKDLLPEMGSTDREALISEVGRILLKHAVRNGKDGS
jgi:hypothetical protein